MAQFKVIVKNLDNTVLLDGVNVTVKWKDFFNNDKKVEAITDKHGTANFNINVNQTTLTVTAKKGASIDKDTVDVNLFGFANPEILVMNLAFKPFEQGEDALEDVYAELKAHGRTIVLGTVIIGSIVGTLFIIGKAQRGELPTNKITKPISNNLTNLKNKSKQAVNKAKTNLKK